VRRFSNTINRGELAVVIGISLVRLDRHAQALEHFETAKRAPMTFPFWYALARRHGRQARDHLSADQTAAIITTAKGRTADDVLTADLATVPN
jgi:hypothetical protein